ncbi:MAG: hypothetical protein QXX78_06915 [Nitrososphaerota archaeon]
MNELDKEIFVKELHNLLKMLKFSNEVEISLEYLQNKYKINSDLSELVLLNLIETLRNSEKIEIIKKYFNLDLKVIDLKDKIVIKKNE